LINNDNNISPQTMR